MNRVEAVDAIKRRWLLMWPTRSAAIVGSVVASSFDNVTKTEETYFAKLTVKGIGSIQRTMGIRGNRRFDRWGNIEVRISGPTNEGTKKTDLLALAVQRIYESVRFGFKQNTRGVVTHACTITEPRTSSGPSSSSWIVIATIPFEYTEVA